MAETKARTLEEEIGILQRCLEERDGQLQASTSTSEQVIYIYIICVLLCFMVDLLPFKRCFIAFLCFLQFFHLNGPLF